MRDGSLREIMTGADVFTGVSAGNILSVADVEAMAPDPILFIMSNSDLEIQPELVQARAGVLATGRSDYPNQVNNVLCFPGFFGGLFLLDSRACRIITQTKITQMKLNLPAVEGGDSGETTVAASRVVRPWE